MAKLNQIIAVEKGVKNTTASTLTDVHHKLQKADLTRGLQRTYQPIDDMGEKIPGENKQVQLRATDAIAEVTVALTKLFDVTAAKEWANGEAKADIVVDGKVLVAAVPATYLLFLEKQLVDIHTFVEKLPVLDSGEVWTYDANDGLHKTAAATSNRTQKMPRVIVKYEATKEHIAQTELLYEDKSVGQWHTVNVSGALPATRVKQLRERVVKLQEATKFAREEANGITVTDHKVGEIIFGYLFA